MSLIDLLEGFYSVDSAKFSRKQFKILLTLQFEILLTLQHPSVGKEGCKIERILGVIEDKMPTAQYIS